MPTDQEPRAHIGDWTETHGLHGQLSRRGEIIELLGSGGHEHHRVRWDEEHESMVYPAGGVIIIPREASASGAGG